ncbi:hypothetical protein [Brevundimonas sp.]|uniref:EF-hand domain-containing protein n=1 Tax=Brevundimonas sp. TaxID=1871086 RepID=UPI002D35827E|nr:hypothetical protein [Brevundimonas sp.]HYC96799.1 hypothetical protein [Brevundimonas sp.]
MTIHANALAASCGALFLLASPALAQTAPEPTPTSRAGPGPMRGGGMGPPRARADVPAWAERLFGRLDANQDAAITGDELAVLTRGPAAAMGGGRLRTAIAQSDASNDGRISREELTAGTERMFTRMDANGDGVLADEEMPRPPQPQSPPSVPMPAPEPMPMPEMPGG